MKVVALVSGGKDSCYAMMECVRYGHEIVCLAHLHPPLHLTAEEAEIDSFMYQSVGHNVVKMIAESMALPLVDETITGTAITTDIDYTTTTDGDEVEDLHRLLAKVKAQFPDVQGVCSGAIFSSYQRNRVENVCSRLGLTSLGYLWRREQAPLLADMVDSGIEAILIKVAAIGLRPRRHLGRTIAELQMELLNLQDKYQLNVCGEGGEYESLTLDCPLFKKRIVIDSSRIVHLSNDDVAFLVIDQCHLEDKPSESASALLTHSLPPVYAPPATSPSKTRWSPRTLAYESGAITLPPTICAFRDQFYLGGIMSSSSSTLTLEEEVATIFAQATATLATHNLTLEDVCFVHLYVRDMNDFGRLNAEYCRYFGQYMPPSRSCVELDSLPSRVLMDCFAIRGSGRAKLEHPRSMRDVLHIKSISAWAPNCIGPYSQANILHKALILLAGQVAFQPETMMIIGQTHAEQTEQSLRNACRVLEALDSNVRHVCSAVVYVAAHQGECDVSSSVYTECRQQMIANAGLTDQYIERKTTNTRKNSYDSDSSSDEDEEALIEQQEQQRAVYVTKVPLLVVELSHLPRHALVEVELQALTHAALENLNPTSQAKRDTVELMPGDHWTVESQSSTIRRALCHVVCTATPALTAQSIDTLSIIKTLALRIEHALLTTADLPWSSVTHLRVFYVASRLESEVMIASAIQSVLGSHTPAMTFVPVEAMQNGSVMALQVTAQDLDKLETDLWLRKAI